MKVDSLENCIATLKKLRDVYHSQIDTSVLAELNTVIDDLEKVANRKQSDTKLGPLGLRALEVIGSIVNLVSNIKDLME